MNQKPVTAFEEAFRKAYSALNDAQKQAVDAVEGPVMVIAGPGTGKTQILALRIANILRQTDIPPDAILALTFTEAGVASMRSRLVSLIGQRGYHVRIHTFHGFCNAVIRAYPERFPRIIGSEQILEIDALSVIETILDTGNFEILRPSGNPTYYVREIKGAISDAKRENIRPDDLALLIDAADARIDAAPDLYHEKGAHKGKMKGMYIKERERLQKAREFLIVYRAYEAALAREHRFDFEDTIIEVVRALASDEELSLILQEQHQYVLADEHQDANGAQNELLRRISAFHESPNLFVVGDEKQAIYRFQGASLANFLSFEAQYPGATIISLASNYRSTQVILDAAHGVIVLTRGHERILRPRLTAHAGHAHAPVSLLVAHDEAAELAHIADDIKERIAHGAEPKEIAVLARRNSDAARLIAALTQRGLLTLSANDEQVFGIPVVRAYLDLLAAVAHVGDDTKLYPLLYAPFSHISNLDAFRLTERRAPGVTLYDVLNSEEKLAELRVGDVASCFGLFATIDAIATYAKDAPLEAVAEYALSRAGILEYIAGHDDRYRLIEALRNLMRYIASVASQHPDYGLRELLASLEAAKGYGLSLLSVKDDMPRAIRVMTAHKAKGLEYDHVYVPFLHDGRWGGKGARASITLPLGTSLATDEDAEDDERRLLYVAMTRARKTLTLSYASRGDDGKEQIPSRFIADIGSEYVVLKEITDEAEFIDEEERLRTRRLFKDAEREYLAARLCEQGMSVSALNNYLENPWKYFFLNLLRMPQPREPHLCFGSAIDAAMKLLTRSLRDGDVENLAGRVIAEFDRELIASRLKDRDLRPFAERGRKALLGYMEHYYRDPGKAAVDASVRFSVPFDAGIPGLRTVPLHGEYDRVEFVEPGIVRVVDFKTGSPKTRNVIEGKTKDSNGNYKRQLVFYALLASLDLARDWRVTEGVIDFVEPDDKGVFHREVFAIEQEEIAELRETLCRALNEISTGAFFDAACSADTWTPAGCALVEAFRRRTR